MEPMHTTGIQNFFCLTLLSLNFCHREDRTMNACLRSCFRFRLRLVYLFSTLALIVFAPPVTAQEEPESASDATKAKPISVAGVVEATVSHELTPNTEEIESWTIKRILPHGSSVKKGQPIVWFETEDAEKQLKTAEQDFRLAKLALDDEEFKYEQFLETQRLDREAAVRAITKARKDHDHFVQIDRPRMLTVSEFSVKRAMGSVENAKEELAQLEQMYRDDDMTEESEKIVLKRAQRSVESAEFQLEGAKIQSDLMINRGIEEQAAENADALERAELKHRQTLRDLEYARSKRDIEMTKKRDAFKEQVAKIEKLRGERRQVVVKSPIDGLVLHGKLNRGRISEKPSALKSKSKVTGNQVIATVVQEGKVRIRVDLAENDLPTVKPGATCAVTFAALPGDSATGVVKTVGRVPYAATKYDCVVTLKKFKNSKSLLPAMTCTLEFKP